MQDLRSGEMKPLNPKFFEGIEKVESLGDVLGYSAGCLQAAKDVAQPDRASQGPVFVEGEILEIRGGKFKIRAINHRGLVLDSMPI